MPGPWEKYQQAAPAQETGPWSKYADPAKPQEKTTADLYPTFSKIPGFEHVRPAFDAAAGAGVAASEHAANIYDFLRKIPGADKVLPDSTEFRKSIGAADPHTGSSEFGKFAEGVAEFALPSGQVAEATQGARLLPRAVAQAATGAGVSAIQSNGDPGSIAAGAAAGAGGEVVGDALKAGAKLVTNRAPSLANFAESFGNATPTQKARISKALDVLERDGVAPAGNVYEMQDVIKGRLENLGTAYESLGPEVMAREVDAADVIEHLRELQGRYTRRGVVTDQPAFDAIQQEIKRVESIGRRSAQIDRGLVDRTGRFMGEQQPPSKLNVKDIVHLKNNANGKTSWNSPDADKSLWRGIGDAYRAAADAIAPETTQLNRDYQKYKDLEQIIDQNIARGKGTTQSGLTALANKMAGHSIGAGAGAAVGGAVAGPVGAGAGSVIGGIIGPKVGKVAARALQDAIDTGAFARFAPAKQGALKTMAAMGDNAGIMRLLGVSAIEEGAVSK